MIGSEEDVTARFASETASVADPVSSSVVSELIPPGASAETEPESFPLEDFITEEFVAMIFSMPGAIMARKTGHEWWATDEDEKELLGKGATPAIRYLVQKYLNDQSGPFAALGAVLGVVYAPKVMREMAARKEEKKGPESLWSKPRQTSPQSAASPPSSASAVAASPTNSFDFAMPLDD